MRNFMRTTAVAALGLSTLLGGCAGSDSLLLAVQNTYFSAQGAATTVGRPLCVVDTAKPSLAQGLLDIEPTITAGVGGSSGQNYFADLVLKWGAEENGNATRTGESFTNYGSLSTTDLIIEEVELGYDFSYAPMEPPTAGGVIPQRITLPAFAWLGKESKAATAAAAVTSSALLSVELVSRAVAAAIDADTSDPTFGDLVTAPNLYTMAVRFRMRARTEAGNRLETSDFSYPVLLCKGCTVNCPPGSATAPSMLNPCYAEWQNQFECL